MSETTPTEPSLHNFAEAMRLEMEGADEQYRRAVQRSAEIWPVNLPPLSPAQKFKNRARNAVRDTRTRVAMKIAPWLDEGY